MVFQWVSRFAIAGSSGLVLCEDSSLRTYLLVVGWLCVALQSAVRVLLPCEDFWGGDGYTKFSLHQFCQRGLSDRKSGHAPYLTWPNFYHETRLLAKLGVKKTTMVACRCSASVFGLFWHRSRTLRTHGMRPCHGPIRAPFTPRTPLIDFYYVSSWYWCWHLGLEGVSFWPISAPICWIFSR